MTECLLASGFLGSSLYMMLTNKNSSGYSKLFNSLSKEKKEAFKKIKKERMIIWLKATLFGIFASITFSKFGKQIFGSENIFNRSCINTLIFFSIQYIVYIIHPKSDWMLNHVENNAQAKAWLSKYKYMQRKWHIGIVYGVIGYFLLNMTLFKSNLVKLA
tara:strand:- start:192 stop:671 length:480 start_codon:yes stop_codon:yes gene_type:complete